MAWFCVGPEVGRKRYPQVTIAPVTSREGGKQLDYGCAAESISHALTFDEMMEASPWHIHTDLGTADQARELKVQSH